MQRHPYFRMASSPVLALSGILLQETAAQPSRALPPIPKAPEPSKCGCSKYHWCLEALQLRQIYALAFRSYPKEADAFSVAYDGYVKHRREANAPV